MTTATRVSILLLIATAACGFPRPPHIFDDAGVGDAGPNDDAGPSDAAQNTTYQLLALSPSTATTGDTVTLEGTFGDTATVHFPGNVSQPATVLGSHRATVLVPATATAGELTVETSTATLGPLPFRRTSFAIGLQSFHKEYEQTDVARQMPSLTSRRSGHSTTIAGASLYVIGGVSSSGYLSSVERASINGDGSLGEFTVAGATLTTARAGHVAFVVGTSLYLVGGVSDSGPLSSIERATINADGSLSAFTIAPISLTTARTSAAGAIVGNHLYVVGGAQSGALDTVERAQISPDGSLGSFSLVSNVKLATARSAQTCTAIGGFLYAIGGSTSSGVSGDIERATISSDGEISTFERVSGATLVTPRTSHTASVMGSTIYVLGGLGSTGDLGTIEKASIAPDGALGPFATVSDADLATARDGHTASIVQNHLYLIGGSNGAYLGGVERGWINDSGMLGTFTATANSGLSTNITCASTAVIGKYIYVVGGHAGNDSPHPLDIVERAAISADGSLGPFALVPGTKLVTARSCHTSAIAGHYLYVIGGNGSGGSGTNDVPLASVERATIDTNGELGPFSTVSGVVLTTKRSSHMSLVINNSLFVVGGASGAIDDLSSVERAAIGTDENLGQFANQTFSTLAVGRSYSALAVIRDTIYVLGGYSSQNGGARGDVEKSAIADDGTIDAFAASTATPLVSPRDGMSAATIGHSLYVLGGFGTNGTVPSSDAARIGRLTLSGPFATTSQATLTTERFSHVSLVIGNFVYNVGGADSAGIDQAPLL